MPAGDKGRDQTQKKGIDCHFCALAEGGASISLVSGAGKISWRDDGS